MPNQVIALLGRPVQENRPSSFDPRFYDPTDGRITIDGQDIRG